MTVVLEPLPGWVSSVGPCTSICDAASNAPKPRSGCFTPWCQCQCHVAARSHRLQYELQERRKALYVDVPLRWEGDDG